MRRSEITAIAILAGATWLAALSPAAAALPPIHDRLNQFFAVLGTEGLAQALAPGLIDKIDSVGNGEFRVWSRNCFVEITVEAVVPSGPPTPGATTYQGHLGEVVCR